MKKITYFFISIFLLLCLNISSSNALNVLPYYSNFDLDIVYGLPEGWSQYGNVDCDVSTIHKYGDTGCSFRIHPKIGETAQIVTPNFQLLKDISEYRMCFDILITQCVQDVALSVGQIEDISDNTNYSSITSDIIIDANNTGIWRHVTIPFSHPIDALTGQDKLLSLMQYFIISVPGACDIYIDNFRVEEKSVCHTPYNIDVSSISLNEFTLSWDGNASEYEVSCVELYSKLPQVFHTILSNDSLVVNQLKQNSSYEVRVRSICNTNDTSEWSKSEIIRTNCGHESLPFYESFDYLSDSIPLCWSQMNIDDNWRPITINSGLNHVLGIKTHKYSNYYIDRVVSTNTINLKHSTQPVLKFDLSMSLEQVMSLSVHVRCDAQSINDEIAFFQDKVEGMNIQLDLSPYIGNEIQIDFKGMISTSNSIDKYIAIDNVSVVEGNYIPNQQVVTIDQILSTSAHIHIQKSPQVDSYNIYVIPKDEALDLSKHTPINVLDASNVVVNNLNSSSSYKVYFQVIIGQDTSTVSKVFPFVTQCVDYNVPIIETFEGLYCKPLLCWTELGRVYTSKLEASSGTKSLRMDSLSSFISPRLINEVNTMEVVLNVKGDDILEVGVCSAIDPVVSSFYVIDTIHATTDFKTQYTIDLSMAPLGNHYVVFRNPSHSLPVYIDNLQIVANSMCNFDNEVKVVDITQNSALVETNASSNDTLEILYGLYNTFSARSGMSVKSKFVSKDTINDLLPNTPYSLFVRKKCSNNSFTPWDGPIDFTTECGFYTLKYGHDLYENLDNYKNIYSKNTLPSCWNKLNTLESDSPPYAYIYNHIVSGNWESITDIIMAATSQDSVYLIAPGINNPLTSILMSMKVKRMNPIVAKNTILEIGSMRNVFDASTFNILDRVDLSQVDAKSYYEYSKDLRYSSIPFDHRYIAFRLSGSSDSLLLDDFRFRLIDETCSEPIDLQVSNISHNSALIAVDCVNTSSSYEAVITDESLNYRDTLKQIKRGTQAYFSNLQNNTQYTVKARSFCMNGTEIDTSSWSSPLIFTTLNKPHIIPYICDFEDTTEHSNWISPQSKIINKWSIQTGYSSPGRYSLMVSNNGRLPQYSNECSFIWAHRLLSLEKASYRVSCLAKAGGNSSDYLRIFLIPSDIELVSGDYMKTNCSHYDYLDIALNQIPDRFIEISDGPFYNSECIKISKDVIIDTPGTYNLAYLWINDNKQLTQPSTLIDSVEVRKIDCEQPVSPTIISVNDTSVSVYSKVINGNNRSKIRYIIIPQGEDFSQNVIVSEKIAYSGDTVVLSNLGSNVSYKVCAVQKCALSNSSFSPFVEFTTQQTPAIIPYFCGFEDSEEESTQWKMNNDTINQFVVGSDTHYSGSKSMYISHYTPKIHGYESNNACNYSYVSRLIHFSPGEFEYSFFWQCIGVSTSDYGVMYVIPAEEGMPKGGDLLLNNHSLSGYSSIPSNWYRSSVLYGSYAWKNEKESFIISQEGLYNIIFVWINNSYKTSNPPLAFDNFQIKEKNCSRPILHLDSVTSTTASFSCDNFTPLMRVYLYDTSSYYPVLLKDYRVTAPNFVVDQLKSNHSYQVKVKNLCLPRDSSSFSNTVEFTTSCAPINAPYFMSFDSSVKEQCWDELQFLIEDEEDTIAGSSLLPCSSLWQAAYGENSTTFMECSLTEGTQNWLVSPSFIVSSNDYLTFNVQLQTHKGTPWFVGLDNQDVFAVMISRDNGKSWTSMQTWNQNSTSKEKLESLSNYFTCKKYALTQNILDTIQIAFYAASSATSTVNTINLDNFAIGCLGDSILLKDTICSGYAYNKNGFIIKENQLESRIYSKFIYGFHGQCNRIKALDLTVFDTYQSIVYDTICQGQVYPFGSDVLDSSGYYRKSFSSKNGCDSIVEVYLQVLDLKDFKDTIICQGQALQIGNTLVQSSGTYIDTTRNVGYCDSLTYWNVRVIPNDVTVYDTICEGDYYELGDLQLTTAGVYHANLLNHLNCDSIVTLNLQVIARDSLLEDSFCSGGEYFFNDTYITKPGIYKDTLINYKDLACDIFVTLSLSEISKDTVNIQDQFCEGDISYNNYGFNIDYPYTHDYFKINESAVTGCDSVTVLHLSKIKTIHRHTNQRICDGDLYYWGGKDYATQGVYTHTFESEAGCDSIVEMTLTVNPKYEISVKDTVVYYNLPYVCLDITVPVGTSIGDYQYQAHGKSKQGCDSVVNLELHIKDNVGLNSVTMNDLVMYPTSVKTGGVVYIHTDFTTHDKKGMSIQLYNTVGKVIKEYVSKDIMAFVMPEVAGVYYMRIQIKNGKEYMGKVIVY